MPIVHIHKITKTIENCINYGKADKVETLIQKDDIADTIRYAENDKTGEIIFPTLTNYTHAKGTDFVNECKELLEKFPRKRAIREGEEPALLYHLIQGFEGYIPPQLANQIGRELTDEVLGRYICQISTHTNTENIHNHIIFCAVSKDGERYNDCDETMALLRKASDRISEKYGLRILESTREYKPIHWIDENGKHHSYEPTKRKSDLIDKKINGELVGDISSYQNSHRYEFDKIKKETLREIIKRDIDSALVTAESYNHLLDILRNQYGYKINDKKKNGDYLAHITFTPPTASKGVRDYKIGDGEFYKRENLEKYILENQEKKNENEYIEITEIEKDNVPMFDKYIYERIDISNIDIERRAWCSNDEIKIVKRGELEKVLIREAQSIEQVAIDKFRTDGFERWKADYILHHLKDETVSSRFSVKSEQLAYAENKVKEIQERLDALHFVEDNHLYNYHNVNDVMKGFWDRYNTSFEKLNEVGSKLERLRFIVQLPQNIEVIQNRINANSSNSKYMNFEYSNDIALLQKYQKYLSSKNLDNNEKAMQKLIRDLHRWEDTYNRLSEKLSEQKGKLLMYERSVEILKTTEDGRKIEMRDTWSEYDSIFAKAKIIEHDNEQVRRNQNNKNKER